MRVIEGLDFSKGYTQIGEPLNLHEAGRPWWANVYARQRSGHDSMGLVLGATTWMIELMRRNTSHVFAADMNETMIHRAESELTGAPVETKGTVEFIQSDWLALPDFSRPFDVIFGDNSFSFLPYPKGWFDLADELADRMQTGATLMVRFLSMPPAHCPLTVDEIVEGFLQLTSINYTAVRTALLFAHWNRTNYSIDTERVCETFERERKKFNRLFQKFPLTPDNDLITVKKYKNSGAVYYAPPLADALDALEQRFRITGVHFGPYAMGQHFPLVVASRK